MSKSGESMRAAWLLSVCTTLFMASSYSSLAAATLEDNFLQPSTAARPWVRWWWPGAAVEDDELRREIDLLDQAGFAGGEIQPFNPGLTNLTPAQRTAVDQYALPPFFAHMKTVTEAAAARGMQIDYTFGSAWPSGGGFAITPELALVELTMSRTSIAGGTKTPIKLTLPPRSRKLGALSPLDARNKDARAAGWQKRFDQQQKLVAVIAIKGSDPVFKPAAAGGFKLFPWSDVTTPGQLQGNSLILTDKLRDDGTLDWQPPPGQWQILVFKQYAANMGVLAGAGEGPQLILDHFRKDAFSAHARRVGDPLMTELGTAHRGLRATFIDSLELMQDLYWSDDFLAQFKARRGYDLTPYLPLIVQPGWMEPWNEHYSPPYYEQDDIGARIRADYRLTVSDLLIDNFVAPFANWNRDHGTLTRFQAHGAPLDTLKAYGMADIPETEDLAGHDPHFMRLARSAADLYGRRLVSAESLCWSGMPFSVTPNAMRQRADLIFASGVNQLVIHGFPYAFQRETWPGWHPFAPGAFGSGFSSFIAETNPIWPAVPRLTAYIARTQAVLQSGRNVVPLALFLGETGYAPQEGQGAPANQLNNLLLVGGYDYDFINADALATAHVDNGRLITAGGAVLSALVLPTNEAIRADTAERMAGFARDGLPILFVDAAPTREQGFLNRIERDVRVKAAVNNILTAGGKIVSQATLVDTLRDAHITANLRFINEARNTVFVEKDVDGRAVYFLHNNGDAAVDASFVTTAIGVVQRWDALAGNIVAQPSTAVAGGTQVTLPLAAGESALLVFDPTAKPVYPKPSAVLEEISLPTSGWQLHASGHGVGGRSIDITVAAAALADWRNIAGLEDLAGTAVYTHKFNVTRSWLKRGKQVLLDLGDVYDIATVNINGQTLPVLIGKPYRVDITSTLKTGSNSLSITVANTPNNALINPKLPGYKDMKPVPAGLLGPITLRIVDTAVAAR